MAMRHIDKSKEGYEVVENGGAKYIKVYGEREAKLAKVKQKRKDKKIREAGFARMKAQEKKDLEVRNKKALDYSDKKGREEMAQLANKRKVEERKVKMAYEEFSKKYSR